MHDSKILNKICYVALAGSLTISASSDGRRITTNKGNAPCKNASCRLEALARFKAPGDWQELLDPRREEFWREGNHLPDRGFLLWATNPTIENAKRYILRMNAKRDVLQKMIVQQRAANTELLRDGLVANDYNWLSHQATPTKPSSFDASAAHEAIKSSTLFFLFDPECPHCEKQAKILKGRSNVIPLQVRGEVLKQFKGLPPTQWAEKEDIKRYVSDGRVPKLVVYNSQANQLSVLSGVRPWEQIAKVALTLQVEENVNEQH